MGSIDKALPHAGFYPDSQFGRKIVIPTLFSNFSPFSFFISHLFSTFADDNASRVATLAHQPAFF